ncbi:MAG TPA: ATP-grasp domain-containing protein [Acidobacteriaceae bacterium]|nr:ATP-grasp domain-containing protein [Acidobacteriaceae bacterium]
MTPLRSHSPPSILLAAATWWPLSARLAMALARHGCAVSAVCPPGHPLRFVSGVEAIYPLSGLNSLESLKAAILSRQPDVIVPCDDGMVWQLHDLHAREAQLRPLIEDSLGPAENYPVIRSRGELLGAAQKLGIRTPENRTIAAEQDLAGSASGVLKLDGTWGGSGVEIAHSQTEVLAAYRRLAQPAGAGVAWKRLLINREALALWSWRKREKPRVTLQQFIPGRPANTMFAVRAGEVLAIVTVEVLCAQGATGAATVVRLVRNDEIARAARLLAWQFKLNGLYGLDFILEQRTGDPYLIEMNPRCTQLGHLRLPGQGDLAGAMVARWKNGSVSLPDDPIDREVVAFFPQAFSWDPKSQYLRHGYHDVPWEEPRLVRELLRQPWPDRQWPARIYHSLRAPKQKQEVRFDYALSKHPVEQ